MKTIIILPKNNQTGWEKLDAQAKRASRNEVLDFLQMVLSIAKYALILALPFILLLVSCTILQAQTTRVSGAKFKLESYSINTNTVVTLFSDYGTDLYRVDSLGKKVYVSLSNLDRAKLSPISEPTEIMPSRMNGKYVNTMQSKKAIVLPAKISTPTIKVTAKRTIVVKHYENTTPYSCDSYLAALLDTNVIVIDSIMIADKDNKADYATLLQEIKATNKAIGYQSKILNKANLGLQREIHGFAELVYNDCHKRPTVFGYLGGYPIYKLCLGIRDLGFKIMKIGRAKKIKKLQAAKKQLIKQKNTFAKL